MVTAQNNMTTLLQKSLSKQQTASKHTKIQPKTRTNVSLKDVTELEEKYYAYHKLDNIKLIKDTLTKQKQITLSIMNL